MGCDHRPRGPADTPPARFRAGRGARRVARQFSSSRLSTRRAMPQRSCTSPTRIAISCSAAAPISSRPTMRPASGTASSRPSSASTSTAARSSRSGCCSCRVRWRAAPTPSCRGAGRASTSDAGRSGRASWDRAAARRARSATSGRARSRTPSASRKRHDRALPCSTTSRRRSRRGRRPRRSAVAERREPVEQLGRGRRRRDECRRVERELQREASRRARASATSPSRTASQPPGGSGSTVVRRSRSPRRSRCDRQLQQLRRDQRRRRARRAAATA